MNVIHTRNVNQVLPQALEMLYKDGVQRDSRNGPVIQYPTPVTTVYHRPNERVLFSPLRNANPFFHLYESLWMLAGRNDVSGVARYADQMNAYSDDKATLHGAYGYRWRTMFDMDQLRVIAGILKSNRDDRRCVLQMWNADDDLDTNGLDVPCNVTATFQVSTSGKLDLTVFCRSNDIIWGAYGANAVHFSFLLEYMAIATGYPMGRLYQVSVNWHAYVKTVEPLKPMLNYTSNVTDYYATGFVLPLEMSYSSTIEEVDERIAEVLLNADHGFVYDFKHNDDEPFFDMCYRMLKAHALYKQKDMDGALGQLNMVPAGDDWATAGRQWLQRRMK